VPIIRRNNCVFETLGTCYSVWMTVWYAYQSSTQNNKYQVSQKHSCFSWWWARPKHVEVGKYTKNKYTTNKLCTKLALFTRQLYILPKHPPTQNSHNIIKYPQYKAMRPVRTQHSVMSKRSNQFFQHTKMLDGRNTISRQKGVRLFSHIQINFNTTD
jgi:hypothetical protein